MKKAQRIQNIKTILLSLMLVLATAVLLSSCSSSAETDSAVALQTALEPTAVIPTPTEETAVAPTAVAATLPTDECLLCHINKDELIQTADPVEEVVSENEGEG
ncbi:MAG: hypothetical protein IPF56_22050 [Chloroflexi bacterium]|nr:hypothetical protein [Chloroflexota bacterium]